MADMPQLVKARMVPFDMPMEELSTKLSKLAERGYLVTSVSHIPASNGGGFLLFILNFVDTEDDRVEARVRAVLAGAGIDIEELAAAMMRGNGSDDPNDDDDDDDDDEDEVPEGFQTEPPRLNPGD